MPRQLTDLFVQNVKAPKTGRTDYADKGDQGLILRVSYTGSKVWSYIYKVPGEGGYSRTGKPLRGKQHRITLGNYPMVSLAEAREQVRLLKNDVERGHDPRAQRLEEAQAKYDNTVEAVGAEMYARVLAEGVIKRPQKIESTLRLYINPAFGHRPIDDISKSDVTALLAKLMKDKKPGAAREAKKYCSRLFNFALQEELIQRNPMAALKVAALKANKRSRVLTDEELVWMWKAAEQLGYPWGDAVKLLLLTGCRKREILSASWSEIKPNERALIIPAERYKTDQTLLVPLSDTAWSVLQSIARRKGDYIFFANDGVSPINSDTYMKTHLMKHLPEDMPHWTIHDLRRTLRTYLPRLGVSSDVAERVIGHGAEGIEGVYNLCQYETEKREAVQKYDDFMMGLIDASR